MTRTLNIKGTPVINSDQGLNVELILVLCQGIRLCLAIEKS